MRIYILLTGILSCSLGSSYAATSSHEYCIKEEQDSLVSRVNKADVVITGTVTRIDTESRSTDNAIDDGGETGSSNEAEGRTGRQTIALVKLWRVVKGSLTQVANYSSGPQDILSDDSENAMMQNPVIKLYGLWNDHFCGSFVKTGDTRIFFLKKFLDVRDIPTKMNLDLAVKNETAPAATSPPPSVRAGRIESSNLRDANSTSDAENLAAVSSAGKGAKKKVRGKKKKKGGKKNKKKERRRKKPRKNGKKTEESLRRRKARRKKRKTSDSMYGILRRIRSKRSSEVVSQVLWMTELEVRVRRDNEPRSVLVLNSSPARINLANLNEVEELAKTVE